MPRYKKEERKLLVKPKLYSGLRQDSQTAPFLKTLNGLDPLTNFGKSSILDSLLCSENAPIKNCLKPFFIKIVIIKSQYI